MSYVSAKNDVVSMFSDYFWEMMYEYSCDYIKTHSETSKELCDALDEFSIHLDEAINNFLNNNINIEVGVKNE